MKFKQMKEDKYRNPNLIKNLELRYINQRDPNQIDGKTVYNDFNSRNLDSS